jgi:type III pantothenate kinase
VVPKKTELFVRAFGKRLHVLHGKDDIGIPIEFRNRAQVGADRLANAIAARHLYGAPAIVIDFGTAVTFDVIDAAGAYVGGVIAPGLNLMTDYLHERTALLPRVTLREPRQIVAQSTVEAICVGAVLGYRGLIREILAALRKELGARRLHVLATGGQAAFVARGLPEIEAVVPGLTLDGLRIWAQMLL